MVVALLGGSVGLHTSLIDLVGEAEGLLCGGPHCLHVGRRGG